MRLELRKKEFKYVNNRETEEARAGTPGEQAGRTDSGTVEKAGRANEEPTGTEAGPAQEEIARDKQRNQVDPAKDDILKAISKLGGIDHAQVLAEWGKTVADSTAELRKRGVFGKPVIRKTNGLKLDRMLESLKGNGYLSEDSDINDLLTAFSDSMRGDAVFANAKEFDLPEQEVLEIDADSPYHPVELSDENLEAVGYNEFISAEANAYEDLVEALNNKEFTNNLIEELEGMPDAEYYEEASARITTEIERVAAEEVQRLAAEEQTKSPESSSKDAAPSEEQITDYGKDAAQSFTSFRKSVADQTATVDGILADAKSLVSNKKPVLSQLGKMNKSSSSVSKRLAM
jgi:hypothetical protein